MKCLVELGKYESEEAAIVDGIRLLKGREELRVRINEGIDQLEHGESIGEETVFDEVEAEISRVESSKKTS